MVISGNATWNHWQRKQPAALLVQGHQVVSYRMESCISTSISTKGKTLSHNNNTWSYSSPGQHHRHIAQCKSVNFAIGGDAIWAHSGSTSTISVKYLSKQSSFTFHLGLARMIKVSCLARMIKVSCLARMMEYIVNITATLLSASHWTLPKEVMRSECNVDPLLQLQCWVLKQAKFIHIFI